MYQGSCLCGGVQFQIQGGITDIIQCHCSLCRKSSGTAFATNGFVDTQSFEIIQDNDLLSFYELRPGKKRHFCKQCGSPIFSSNADNPSRIRIRLGVIDSEITERPISHNFVSSKAGWDSLNETLPHYDAHEPSRNKNPS